MGEWRVLCIIVYLVVSMISLYWIPLASHCNNRKCVQTLTNTLRKEAKLFLVQNPCTETEGRGKDCIYEREGKNNNIAESTEVGSSGFQDIEKCTSFIQKRHILLWHQNERKKKLRAAMKFAFWDGTLVRESRDDFYFLRELRRGCLVKMNTQRGE